ncbi:hypothetical protein ACFQ60_36585 [Streptomyces zhihengii]
MNAMTIADNASWTLAHLPRPRRQPPAPRGDRLRGPDHHLRQAAP